MEDFEMSCLVQFFKGQSKSLRTALFVVAFLSGVAFGQINSGQLTGKVYDPNGARVPGAIVQVKSEETGLERLATTSDEGLFVITNLPPGIYEVGVQAQGFAVMTRRVRVFVGSAVRVDSQLSVTPVVVPEEIVEGSGGVKINTQTGQLSDPVSGRQLRELPVITRDPYSLVTLSGNVTPFRINPLGVAPITGGFGFSAFPFPIVNTEPDQDFAIDGQPPTFNNVQVDGGENIVNYWSTLGQRMPLEGVQEINVITNGFRPEFGRLGGGLINVATRPGGSFWRGSLFEFYRGDALNATSFEANALGIRKGHLVGNNFGGAIGGPVIDDKLYFFVSGEGIKVRSRENRVALVPDPAFLATPGVSAATGAFFGAFPLGPVTFGRAFTLADTVTLLGGPGAFTTPTGTPSPFLALATATPGTPAFRQVFFDVGTNIGGGLPQDTALAVGRFDWTKSDRSLIYGRYAYLSRDIFRGALSFSPFAGFNSGFHELDHNAQINWLYTLSAPGCCSDPGASPWLMNLKANYNRVNLRRNNDFNTAVAPRLAATGFAFPNIGGFPLAFPGDFPFDANLNSLFTGALNLFQASADFAGAWRGHQLQFGGSYYYFQDNRNIFSFQNGLFTLGPDVPTALDSLVTGTASSFSVAINPFGALPGSTIPLPVVAPDFNRSISNHDFSLYGSFNWRVTPNFNLLLGLRYDFFNLPRSRNDEIFFNFFPGAGTTVPAQVASGAFVAPGTFTGAAFTSTRVDTNRRFFRRDSDNIAPRIGFAWDFTGGGAGCCTGLRRSTTLRGSFGLTYERLFYAVSPFFQENATFGIPTLVAGTLFPGTTTTIPPIPLITTGVPATSTFGPLGGAAGTTVPLPFLVRGIDRDLEAPRISFWTVALDREIAHNTVGSLQYAGAHGHDLFTVSNINRPGSASAFLGPGFLPTDRLNPALGPVFFLRSNGRSNYNAFIADLSNSTWRTIGLSFTARYRFAKALDNVNPFINENFNVGLLGTGFTTNLLSPFDPENDYGPSDFDVRHRFIGSFIWEIPDFFDRSCCGGNGGWKRWLLSGWAVTGIFQAMTGFPFTVFDCAGALTPETPCPRALVASGVDLDDIRTGQGSAVPDTTVPNRFNFLPASNFAVAPTTTVFPPFTGLGPTVGRNFFRGPGFRNFDFGVYKRFRISEDVNFQLRGEFYNVFNHANLFVPSAVDINSTNFVPAFKRGGRIVQVGGKLYF
jgi:Carboxypeptidase regulatory-like domain/TonB dependent receptor-like, beta-barrel